MTCRQNIEFRSAVGFDQVPFLPFSFERATDSQPSAPRVPGLARTLSGSPISSLIQSVPAGPLVPEIPNATVVVDVLTYERSPMSPRRRCRLVNISRWVPIVPQVPRCLAHHRSPQRLVSPNVPQVPHVPAVCDVTVGCSISREPQIASAPHWLYREVPGVPSVPKVPGIFVPEVPPADTGWAANFTSPRGQSARLMGPGRAAWGRSSGAALCYTQPPTDTSCGQSTTCENREGKEGQRFLPVHQNPAKQTFKWLKNQSFSQKRNPDCFHEGRPGDINPQSII